MDDIAKMAEACMRDVDDNDDEDLEDDEDLLVSNECDILTSSSASERVHVRMVFLIPQHYICNKVCFLVK